MTHLFFLVLIVFSFSTQALIVKENINWNRSFQGKRIDLILQEEIRNRFYKPIHQICINNNLKFYPINEIEQRKVINALKPLKEELLTVFKDILINPAYTLSFKKRVLPTDPAYPLYQQFLYFRGMEEDLLEFVLDRSHWNSRVLYLDVHDKNEEKHYGKLRDALFNKLRSNPEDNSALHPNWTNLLFQLFTVWQKAFQLSEINDIVTHYPHLYPNELQSVLKHPSWVTDILSNIGAFKCLEENDQLCLLAIIDRYGWVKE